MNLTESDTEGVQLVIGSGLPLSELNRYFPNQRAALRFYAQAMGERHRHAAGERCELCRSGRTGTLYAYVWEARAAPKRRRWVALCATMLALELPDMVSPSDGASFVTHHRVCEWCHRWLNRRRRFAAVFTALLMVLWVLVAIVGLGSLFLELLAVFLENIHRDDTLAMFLRTATIMVCSLIAIAVGFRFLRHWVIPASLRGIGRFPFVIKCIWAERSDRHPLPRP